MRGQAGCSSQADLQGVSVRVRAGWLVEHDIGSEVFAGQIAEVTHNDGVAAQAAHAPGRLIAEVKNRYLAVERDHLKEERGCNWRTTGCRASSQISEEAEQFLELFAAMQVTKGLHRRSSRGQVHSPLCEQPPADGQARGETGQLAHREFHP